MSLEHGFHFDNLVVFFYQGVAVRAIVISQLLVVGLLCGCGGTEIVHDLEEGEANRILAALSGSGVQGGKVKVTKGSRSSYIVTVQRGDAIKAWQVLRRQNLPRPKRKRAVSHAAVGGLLAFAQQRRTQMNRALATDIAKTLLSVTGVVDARIHVVRPSRHPLAADATRPSPRASVLLRTSGKSPLTKAQVRALVRGAVAGLADKDVSVVMVSTGPPEKTVAAAPQAKVGPFVVAPGTRGPLLATCIVATLVVVCLGLALLALVRQNRQFAAQLQRLARQQEMDEEANRDLESSLSLLDHSFSHRRTARRGARRE